MFVVVSALKLLAAYWIWNTRRDGAILELILLGVSTVF
jgi:di/tricarboxylate transporter